MQDVYKRQLHNPLPRGGETRDSSVREGYHTLAEGPLFWGSETRSYPSFSEIGYDGFLSVTLLLDVSQYLQHSPIGVSEHPKILNHLKLINYDTK